MASSLRLACKQVGLGAHWAGLGRGAHLLLEDNLLLLLWKLLLLLLLLKHSLMQ